MGQAIAVRTDYTAGEVRVLAKRVKDAAQARRLLAIAAVLDGASRTEAAKIGGMDRQTLRDWVIRFNDQGPDGLINIASPGVPPKLDATHRAFLARIAEEGPIPAVHGVVRWRACDLIMRLHEEFGISVSDDTIYRALKDLGFSHAAALTRAQQPREHMAVHASELAVEPDIQILRRYRRSLLLRLEYTHPPTLEDNVHRPTRLGHRRSLIVRIGIRSYSGSRAPTANDGSSCANDLTVCS